MAKVSDILTYCKAVRPNVFADAVLLRWLNECEGYVQTEIMRLPPHDCVRHSVEGIETDETVVGYPHDKLYGEYVCARICEAEGEIARANNDMTRFNDFVQEFARWFHRNYSVAQACGSK